MTQEEKARAYDESLERAKDIKIGKVKLDEGESITDYIFSELKESEDERIRKAILNHLKKMWGNSELFGIEGPAQRGGVGEERQRNHEDDLGHASAKGQALRKRRQRDVHALQAQFRPPGVHHWAFGI